MRRSYYFEGSMDEARTRVDRAMARNARRFPRYRPRYDWIGPYCAEARFRVPLLSREQRVELQIHPDRIDVRSRLPRLLRAFVPRIFEVLDRHARAALDSMMRGAA